MNDSANGWSRNPVGGFILALLRAIAVALGLFMILISPIIAVLTPILPIGLPLFALGLLLVAAASKTAHRIITNYLRRHPALWNRVKRAFGERD